MSTGVLNLLEVNMNTERRVFAFVTSLISSFISASLLLVYTAKGEAAWGTEEQKPSQASFYWIANLEIRTLVPGRGSGAKPPDKDLPSHRASEITLRYQVYQNPRGIARHELRSSPPLTVIGVGREVHIIDFNSGTRIAFDKAQPVAIRSKLSDYEMGRFPPQSIALGRKNVLGYGCRGVEVRSQDPKTGGTEVRQAWIATGIGFREPLRETIQHLNSSGESISTTEKVITRLRSTQQLDPSLFKVPEGYKITD